MLRPSGNFVLGFLVLLIAPIFMIVVIFPDTVRLKAYFPPEVRDAKIQCGAPQAFPPWELSPYLGLLVTTDEPSLYALSRSSSNRRSYRFAYVTGRIGKTIIVRLDELSDGTMKLTAKRMARPSFEPGRVEVTLVRLLTSDEQARFERALATADNLYMTSFDCQLGPDGWRWFFEVKDEGGYRFVDRWTPGPGAIFELGKVMQAFPGWTMADGVPPAHPSMLKS
jgi:hypothetical protein